MIDVFPVGLVARALDCVVVIVAAGEYIATAQLETVIHGLRVGGSLIEMVPHVLETGEAMALFITATLLLPAHGIVSVPVEMVVETTGRSATARILQRLLRPTISARYISFLSSLQSLQLNWRHARHPIKTFQHSNDAIEMGKKIKQDKKQNNWSDVPIDDRRIRWNRNCALNSGARRNCCCCCCCCCCWGTGAASGCSGCCCSCWRCCFWRSSRAAWPFRPIWSWSDAARSGSGTIASTAVSRRSPSIPINANFNQFERPTVMIQSASHPDHRISKTFRNNLHKF